MARAVGVRYAAQSNRQQSGAAPGGTMGGRPAAAGRRPGSRSIALGDEVYLWVLVVIEAILMSLLRKSFKRRHGG